MKKLLTIFMCLSLAAGAKAQFPTTDSLKAFINRYMRNSPVESFQNLRLNTALLGLSAYVDSARRGALDTAFMINDSTMRIITQLPDTFDVQVGSGSGSVALDSARTATYMLIINGADTTKLGVANRSLSGAEPPEHYALIEDSVITQVTNLNDSVTAYYRKDGALVKTDTSYSLIAQDGLQAPTERTIISKGPVYKTFDEFRNATIADTAFTYYVRTNKQSYAFRYDPSDASSADDTATVIVDGSGHRFKRIFSGIYRPEDFGAKGDGTTDDWWAWQKMMNYINHSGGLIWCSPFATYKIDTSQSIIIPHQKNRILTIMGNGASVTGKNIFIRRPANQSDALNVEQDTKISFVGLRLACATANRGNGIELGATYGAEIINCRTEGFDTAIVIRFGLNTRLANNNIVNPLTGIVFTYGGNWGGSTSNSQSNGSSSTNDRVNMKTNGNKGYVIEAASDIRIERSIVEGQASDYAFYFDSRADTHVINWTLDGCHIEMASPGPKRAGIYYRGAGTPQINDIYVQVVDTFLIADQTGTLHMRISGVPFLPTGKIATTSSATIFDFYQMPNDWRYDQAFVVSGSYVAPCVSCISFFNNSMIITNGDYYITDSLKTSGKYFGMSSASGGNFAINSLAITSRPDRTNDFGKIGSTLYRPRDSYFGRNVYLDSTTNIKFTNSANTAEFNFYRVSSGVLRMDNTGGLDIPKGTTAQRPSNYASRFRWNSDSSQLEVNTGSAWKGIVFTDFSNTTIAGGGGSATWGSITGTLSSQTDLQSALDAKQNTLTYGTLTGTANQVNLSASGSNVLVGGTNITLSLPQSIATTSSPQFAKLGLNTASTSSAIVRIGGAFSNIYGNLTDPTLSPNASSDGVMQRIGGTFVENSTGTHDGFYSLKLDKPTVTSGAATVNNTALLYVDQPMTATVTGDNYSAWIKGKTRIDNLLTKTSTPYLLGKFDDSTVVTLTAVPVANGGTGLTSLGSANQQLRVNAGGTALEYFTPSSVTLASGTYTPTASDAGNIDAQTIYDCNYMRVGNTVTVSGKIEIDPTAATTATTLNLTLPVASNFTANEQCAGTISGSNTNDVGAIRADITNDKAQISFISTGTGSVALYFTFTYTIL